MVRPDHPPTVGLLRRWVANLSFGVVNGAVVSLFCASCYILTSQGLLPVPFALLRAFPVNPWVRVPLEVLVLDLVTYGLHRAYHTVPFLWRLHLVHHTDLDLDVSSASRFHTGEVVVSGVLKVGVVLLLGITPAGLVVFEAVMLACAQFQHANIRLPARVEAVLWKTFVPPAMHRIHHTPPLEDTNSNFGTIVTLWDALFGTLNRRPADAAPSFGVPELREPDALGPFSLALLPFRRARASSAST